MSRIISDAEQKEAISSLYNLIGLALKCGQTHIAAGANGRPEIIDSMFDLIRSQTERAKQYRWPDPAARLAEAAGKNVALQKLIKRASKPTPIRAA